MLLETMLHSEINVLDHGFVRLDSSMADDMSVVNSARVSFGKRSTTFKLEDDALLRYLMKNRHGTPFEHNALRFHVRAPIFIFREWQRHRIGSFNEMSARYMELPGLWYIPEYDHVRVRVGKPGHYTYEPATLTQAQEFCYALEVACSEDYAGYTLWSKIIAPEQARMFLHVNHYSEMYWTVNARSLMNFLSLRNHPTAQWEIQQYAKVIEDIWQYLMPSTAQAFIDGGRIAP
jgi:thymidylate synthase (FAD)